MRKCENSPESVASEEIDKIVGHIKRATFDAFKVLFRKNAMVPQEGDLARRWPGTLDDPIGPPETRSGLTRYMRSGYVAADETNESVSRTLDYALDDKAVGDFAAALGKVAEAAFFRARAKS